MATPAQAARALEDIRNALETTDGLAEAYARAMLQEGVSRAAGHPTPQSRMAAAAMGVQGTAITVLTGGPPAEVSAGSEWGSDIYPQFGPRREGGYWLLPSAESETVKVAGDAYLEAMMQREVRGF